MMPTVVRYSGLTVDARDLLEGRVVKGPIPPSWLRVRFAVDSRHTMAGAIEQINRWLAATLHQRWALYIVPHHIPQHQASNLLGLFAADSLVVIAFESDTDAVLFRLKGGATAWQEEADSEP